MAKQIPQDIIEKHGYCTRCSYTIAIEHLSKLDEDMRRMIKEMFNVKNAWVIYCEKCDNLGIIKEIEA